jgi:hypothetical protein
VELADANLNMDHFSFLHYNIMIGMKATEAVRNLSHRACSS